MVFEEKLYFVQNISKALSTKNNPSSVLSTSKDTKDSIGKEVAIYTRLVPIFG